MTAVTGTRNVLEYSAAMISADDLALAREFIYKSPSTGKWLKPQWQAAAAAMAWFIRELPGSPMLMNRVLDRLKSNTDPIAAREEAANLIRAQHGLDASVLTTSTQVPGVDELDVSLIPGNQAGYGAGAGGGSRLVLASSGSDVGIAASPSAPGRTTPVASAPAPAAAAAAATVSRSSGGGGS